MQTHHSVVRCQQRGVRPEVIEVLLTYGRRRQRGGAEICFMDRTARRHAEKALGGKLYARVADRLDTYLVVADDGAVVTAAKRLKRLRF